MTNLVSSFTALCFGVPTALLVLSHLGNAQNEAREFRKTRAQATREIADFQAAILDPFAAADIAQLKEMVTEAQRSLNCARDASRTDGGQGADAFEDFVTALADLIKPDLLTPPGTRPYHLFTQRRQTKEQLWPSMNSWEELVKSQWKILADEVRPQARDAALPWLPLPQAARAHRSVAQLQMQGRNPWKLGNDVAGNGLLVVCGYFLTDLLDLCQAALDLSDQYPPQSRLSSNS
ncbi:hypothetical protein P1P68_06095 [Streptomyces scabiei]|uniref:hypothetical protein n=1 Tax=Streptomyces scabiei TaxID=1930 RepID=UPI0029902118|nr:hypothetical protein [Streptomyces scabiei]MDW8804374.1 hypothetical protein [Streptomyces scabiei]